MLQIIVDWFSRSADRPATPAQVIPDRSTLGFRFQREEFEKLFNAINEWHSVEFFTALGTPINSMDDLPRGPDGGVDGVIRITTETERGAKIVAGRIRSMILKQTY